MSTAMTTLDQTTVTTALDGTLVDLINLGLLAKQAHWNLVGPSFRELHLLLDEVADLARDAGDTVAERAVTLGHHPDGRAETVAHGDVLPPVRPGALRDTDAITTFGAILGTVITRLRDAIAAVSDDLVTQDLLTRITADVEKLAWMIRAQGQ